MSPKFIDQRGQLFEPEQQSLGLFAAVQLDIADHDIHPFGASPLCGLEHRVGLADAGIGTEEDGQAPAQGARLALLHLREQQVGIRPVIVHP